MINLILTIIGNDKPGLVESLSQTIVSHNGNWLESRMARMAGKFAGILDVSVPEKNSDQLIQALEKLESKGLKIVIEKSAEDNNIPEIQTLELHILGNDRPGIIKEVSQALSIHGINVDELVTDCKNAPMSGEPLFSAIAKLSIPKTSNIECVRGDLEQISNELMVDITLG